jgi:predicted short-subunit dehydrogenase-like oxidoreductase (DUF2520 family)
MIHKICFIGAGNLATHLSQEIQKKGYKIVQVYSRTKTSAERLAIKLGSAFTVSLEEITNDADIFFIALRDSAVQEVLQQIDVKNKLLVHCSGSLPLSALYGYSNNIGVLYPLQTFSKDREIVINSIPVFVEANSKENEKLLLKLAGKISKSVSVLHSDKRKSLHISAVFACNFVNHLYTIASDLLQTKNIPFEVLRPLILETALKVQEMDPTEAQTGPAIRFDNNIITSHLQELRGLNNYEELYSSISKSIFNYHKNRI